VRGSHAPPYPACVAKSGFWRGAPLAARSPPVSQLIKWMDDAPSQASTAHPLLPPCGGASSSPASLLLASLTRTPLCAIMENTVVIDGRAHMYGRLASVVAKQLLSGQKIVVVRAEQMVISGSREYISVAWMGGWLRRVRESGTGVGCTSRCADSIMRSPACPSPPCHSPRTLSLGAPLLTRFLFLSQWSETRLNIISS
jgi:hypothetical protein